MNSNLPRLNELTTLLLDMDGTLLDLRFDNHFWVEHLPRRFQHIHGGTEDSANTHIADSLRRAEGTMNWYCIDYWSDHFQVNILALKREVEHLIRYRQGSKRFLEHLTDLDHLQVILVTDAHPDVLALKQKHTGLLDHVHAAFSSHYFGAPKRQAEFWTRLAEEINFEPDSTLMIDDNPAVLGQAKAFGIAHQLLVAQPDSGINSTAAATTDFEAIDLLDSLVQQGMPQQAPDEKMREALMKEAQ